MNVLVTGGYGFIGSHVAEIFYKEGHKVFIIDNLSTGDITNVNCKHKAYILNVEDKKCDEVFQVNKFDIVVHLVEGNKENYPLEDSFKDTKSNVIGLVNMLELSVKHQVKKFIFSSSASVYGNKTDLPIKESEKCEPISPCGISKLIEEECCLKWKELYKLETLCFRISNVYGPRQGLIDKGGVVSLYIKNLLENKELTVYGDGNQSRDFIYVGDVAESIYKASQNNISGIYNLSTNSENSINELIDILKEFYDIKGVNYKPEEKIDIVHSYLDNTKVTRDLNWIPKVQFKEGIKLTNNWYMENYTKKINNSNKDKKINLKANFRRVRPYLETVLLFMVIILIDKFIMKDSVFRIFDLKLLYIVICAITYGTKQSVISILIASFSLIYEYLSIVGDASLLMLDTNFVSKVSIYMLVGIIIGYTIDKKDRIIEYAKVERESIQEKYLYLQEVYDDTYKVKTELQNQIFNSDDSFGKIYGIINRLNSLETWNVYKAALEVLESILKVNLVSIYTVNKTGKSMKLVVNSKKKNFNPKNTMAVDELEEFKEQLFQGEIAINRKMKPNIPIIMAPLMDEDKLIGIAMLHEVEFENLTLYFENLVRVVSKLIASSIVKADMFENKITKERYIQHINSSQNYLPLTRKSSLIIRKKALNMKNIPKKNYR